MAARHPAGVREVRAELGLRLLAPAPRRFPVRPGAPRNEDGRPLVYSSHRQDDRGDPLACRAANERHPGIARFLHDPGASRVRRQERAGHHRWRCRHRPRSGDRRRALAPRWSQSAEQSRIPHRASPVILDGIIIAPTRVRPMLAIKPGGKGDITETHRYGRSTTARTYRLR